MGTLLVFQLLTLWGDNPNQVVVVAQADQPVTADNTVPVQRPITQAVQPAAQSACTATVTARQLNQRSGPGENYGVISGADRGESFTVSGRDASQDWVLVTTGDGLVWMSARYVALRGSCDQLPVSSEINTTAPTLEPPPTATPFMPSAAVPSVSSASGIASASTSLSPVFTPEVQYWAPLIEAWAVAYSLNPNLIATVIQIESCGDPTVSSSAGAQGLFQVMPFHFSAGENMLDVETNARRGLAYLKTGLELARGDVGMALAGYNGGHGVITRGIGSLVAETQRYYYWGSGIYNEAVSGATVSPTLQEWLSAGGSSLCARAAQSQRSL